MLGLYVDYSSGAVMHLCAVSWAYLFRDIWQQCEMYVYQVFVVTLVIAVSTYSVFVLI